MRTSKRIVWFPLLSTLLFLLLSGSSAIGQGKCVFEGSEVPCDEWTKKPTASSTGKCTWNNKEVPCEEIKAKMKDFFGLGMGVAIVLGVLALVVGAAFFVFWVLMLVHAASNAIENKVMWIVLMVFIGLPVSVVYYFVVKRNFVPPPQQPPVAA